MKIFPFGLSLSKSSEALRQAQGERGMSSWLGWLVVLAAFLLGIGTDAISTASHTVNILAPPLLLLMLWNVAVYAFIAINSLFKSRHFKLPTLDQTQAIALARGTTVMHSAAAALAFGALMAMYWRGLVFDFQAMWQSTFLSASAAHMLVYTVLYPAISISQWLGGSAAMSEFPNIASFAQLRAPHSSGENAARWIHWYAITVLWVVLLPRAVLAWWSHRQANKLANSAKTIANNPYITPASSLNEYNFSKIETIALSLVAHTNVGKTTLARTMLGRDIGEVRNAEHVTHTAERYMLVEAVHGTILERLELWDTPGFGDSELMAKRMSQAGNPIGWFLAEVWDRLQNRAFWYSQRAVRHILDESDVVLYLINASENPADVSYLNAELKVLDLIGKPVVVLLNQIGDISTPEMADVEIQRWKVRVSQAVSGAACVKDVLLLDAFTRCWVQEGRLLESVAQLLPKRQAVFARLKTAWEQRNLARWHASMATLAQRLCRAASDVETVKESTLLGKITARVNSVTSEKDTAMQRLAERLELDIRKSTDALITLHQLDGSASKIVLTRMAEHVALKAPKSEGKAALWGGVLAGALMGLKADILSGGMTLGGGMLAGGVLGALGGAGLARGYNYVKGVDSATMRWTPQVLDNLVRSALLGYLAVAHFGRGRGEWTQTEPPAFWVERIEAALEPHWVKLHALWDEVSKAATPKSTSTLDTHTTLQAKHQAELQTVLQQTSQSVLESLYPEAGHLA